MCHKISVFRRLGSHGLRDSGGVRRTTVSTRRSALVVEQKEQSLKIPHDSHLLVQPGAW